MRHKGSRAFLEQLSITAHWLDWGVRTVQNFVFDGLDLSGLQLAKVSFTDCTFKHTNLQAVSFDHCTMDRVLADNADFSGARLSSCLVKQTILDKALFVKSEVADCFFYSSSLQQADLSDAYLGGTTFGCVLDGAKISPPFPAPKPGTLGLLVGPHIPPVRIGLCEFPGKLDPRYLEQGTGFCFFPKTPEELRRILGNNLMNGWAIQIPEGANICVPYGSRGTVWTDRVLVLDEFSFFCLEAMG